MNELLGWLQARLWHNGGKLSLVVLALGAVAVTLTALTIDDILRGEDAVNPPITVRAPFEVTNSPVEQGRPLVLLADFCNSTSEAIAMRYEGVYVEIGGEGFPVRTIAGNEDDVAIQPGCNVVPFAVLLPPEVTPGFWYRTSVRTYHYNGSDQTVETRTEVFEVVPGAGE